MSLHNRTPHEHSTIKKTSPGWWPKPQGELPPVVTVKKQEINMTDKPVPADGLNPEGNCHQLSPLGKKENDG